MNSEQMKGWLKWRKQVGLPPVPVSKLNAMLKAAAKVREVDEVEVEKPAMPQRVAVYTRKKYLWGLITIYKRKH